MLNKHTNSDTAWKDILDAYFPELVNYCLPKLNVLIDWKKPWESLNPFASVILCQLAALESKRKPDQERYNIKYHLTRRLYNKGFDQTQIKNLYLFIDWIINLPRSLEIEYHQQLYQFEEESKMAYISTAERLGIEKGFSQGISQGKQEGEATLLTRLLTRKFGSVPPSYQKQIANADAEVLLQWGERVLFARALEEIFR